MTEKEAIYILRNAAWLGSNEERQKVEEAVEVVAKAIEAQDMTLYMNLPEVSVEEAVEILKRNSRFELISSAKDTNVPSNDTIYRQDAIDMVKDVCDAIMSGCESWYDPETEDEVYKDILEVDAILKCNKEIRIALRNMPSAMIPLEVEKAKGRKTCGLECLRCKQTYNYSLDTMDEISYTMYSYCPDCIRKGIQLLKSKDKEGEHDE